MAEKKNNLGKKVLVGLTIVGLAFAGVKGINTLEEKDLIDVGGGIHFVETEEPTNVVFENNVLSWTMVDGAKEYVIKCDGNTYKTTDDSYDFSSLTPGEYDIKIKATSENKRDSNYVKLEDCFVKSQEIINQEIVDALAEIERVDFRGSNCIQLINYYIEDNKLIALCAKIDNYVVSSYSDLIFELPENYDEYNLAQYITPDNYEINNMYIGKYDYYIKYNKAPLVGNLLRLEQDGWEIEKISEIAGYATDEELEKKGLYLQYFVYAKCTKGETTKYVLQRVYLEDKLKEYDTVFKRFEKGMLNSTAYQSCYREYTNLSYANENFELNYENYQALEK